MVFLQIFSQVDSKLTLILLFAVFLILLFWYYRSYIAPYSKLPSYSWIMECNLMYSIITGRGTGEKPLMNFIFQKVIDICNQHLKEGMCVIWHTEPFLFVFGEEAVKTFANELSAIDKPKIYRVFEAFAGNTIFMSKGEEWKKQKKLISPAFYSSMLKDIAPIVNNHASVMIQKLNDVKGRTFWETEELLQACALNIFFESSLGIKADNSKYVTKLKCLTKGLSSFLEFTTYRIFNIWLSFDFALKLSPFGREHLQLIKEVGDIIEEILQDLKEAVCSRKATSEHQEAHSDEFSQRRKDFGEVLIEQHLMDPSLTIEDIKKQLLTLIVAGFDTVSHAMQFCLFVLGLHPDVQEKAYNEVISITDEDIQYTDLCKMIYMECVIKESLRMYPAGPFYGRHLKKDVYCGKYKVPKNTTIIFSPYILHRNPHTYPDPENFDPTRFLESSAKIKPWTYIPFAEGARSCIGKNYAMMEMKILLAHILRNFKIVSLDRTEDLALSFELTLKSVNPLRMKFIPR